MNRPGQLNNVVEKVLPDRTPAVRDFERGVAKWRGAVLEVGRVTTG
jgi:hypothetical protein